MDIYTITIVSTEENFHLIGLMITDNGYTTSPPNQSLPIVEFIGHDFMLSSSSFIPYTFPWLVSQQLNIDHVHIAYPHATLLDQPNTTNGMQTRYFHWSYNDSSLSPSHLYDFSSYTPSVIVLLLGKYDHDIPQYKTTLVQFISNIRQQYSSSIPILILSEPFGDMIRSTQAAVYDLNDKGDQYVYYLDTTSWLKYEDDKENNDHQQFIFAEKLAPMIQVKLAKPPLPLPSPPPNPALPDAWETMDVGNPGLHGSVSFDAGSAFTLWGSGRPNDDQTDAFRFVYQPLSGQGIIEATIQSHATFATCAKAGIMLREHLALGSAHLSIGISPQDGLFVRKRDYNFNHTHLLKKLRAKPPYRLRLQRTAQLNEWIAQAKPILLDPPSSPMTSEWETIAFIKDFSLARDIYIGLYVTSCDDTVVSVAKYTDVSVQGGVGRINFLLENHLDENSPRFIDQSHP
ncbi:unnamed protein product [Cunninghamella blakesleeana]